VLRRVTGTVFRRNGWPWTHEKRLPLAQLLDVRAELPPPECVGEIPCVHRSLLGRSLPRLKLPLLILLALGRWVTSALAVATDPRRPKCPASRAPPTGVTRLLAYEISHYQRTARPCSSYHNSSLSSSFHETPRVLSPCLFQSYLGYALHFMSFAHAMPLQLVFPHSSVPVCMAGDSPRCVGSGDLLCQLVADDKSYHCVRCPAYYPKPLSRHRDSPIASKSVDSTSWCL